ncbi:MAG: hypothetical protein Q4E78_09805 [Eubacteriales bacterium]|nr:hypothetical protein [Eubacteriales bacterium]
MIKSLVNNMSAKVNSIVRTAVKEERGDTNFISILIILGIVIILAGVFMAFKDQIVGQVQNIINGFTIS